MNLTQIAILVLQVVLFIGFELWLAPIIVQRHGHWLDRLKIPNAGFVVALIVMLEMAALSELIGLAGMVGTFFAGMMLAETEELSDFSRQVKPLYEWLVHYFFDVTGPGGTSPLCSPTRRSLFLAQILVVHRHYRPKVIGCSLVAWVVGLEADACDRRGHGAAREGLIIAATGLAMGVIGDATSYRMVILVVGS